MLMSPPCQTPRVDGLGLLLGGLLLAAGCGGRALPLAPIAERPVIPQPREPDVLAYDAVAPKGAPELPRSVMLPPPESTPLPATRFPRHLAEGDRAGPDAQGAAELYELAKASTQPELPLAGALVACRALGKDPGHRFDWFGKPELQVRLSLGSTPNTIRNGGQDQPLLFFTVPGVHLKKGEGLRLEVFDRDVTKKELMARREPVFDGKLPIEITARHARLVCAVVPQGEVDRRAVSARGHTDSALGRLERQEMTRAPQVDWGFPRKLVGPAVHSLRSLASMWGWEHPEVLARTRRYEHWRTRWDLAAEAHVAEILRRLPATGEWISPRPSFALKVADWRCEPPDRGSCPSGIDCDRDCVITLEVENRSAKPWVPDGGYRGLGQLGIPWMVLEEGSTRTASLSVVPMPIEVPPEATPVEASPPGAANASLDGAAPPVTTTLAIAPGAFGRVEVRSSLQRGHRPQPRLLWFTSSDLLLALVPSD